MIKKDYFKQNLLFWPQFRLNLEQTHFRINSIAFLWLHPIAFNYIYAPCRHKALEIVKKHLKFESQNGFCITERNRIDIIQKLSNLEATNFHFTKLDKMRGTSNLISKKKKKKKKIRHNTWNFWKF